MKCPKCGFNSFEYYDSCKKCSADLKGFKQTYSISSLVLPQEAKAALVAKFQEDDNSAEEKYAAPEAHDDIFSFDLPDDSPISPHKPVNDPFDFGEPATAPHLTDRVNMEDHMFGDLLESTPHAAAPSFTPRVSAVKEPAASLSSEKGELDFDSFAWDDAPVPAATSKIDDTISDFDSLFDENKEKSPK